jgi:hypothetical protein
VISEDLIVPVVTDIVAVFSLDYYYLEYYFVVAV